MAFWNNHDYKINSDDLIWSRKIENQIGETYLENSNIIFGGSWNNTFIVLSPETGDILDTLTSYKVMQERESLILEETAKRCDDYRLFNIVVDKNKYSNVALKVVDRKYRGADLTYYLIVNTIANKEITILFNSRKFSSISDIIYFKEGKFVMKYNSEAGATSKDPFITNIALFDLDKIIK